MMNYKWYIMELGQTQHMTILVLGQYKLVLLGIRWYMVSKGRFGRVSPMLDILTNNRI